MREIKNEAKYYLEHRIGGAYETTDLAWLNDQTGIKHRAFEDSTVIKNKDNLTVKRIMDIEGKVFTVCSIFPTISKSSPTTKMLKIIAQDLEK